MAFDWPDRPKASPTGSALIQSRSGRNGNFEVVIPWPNGGLAHFWRNNDEQPGFPWHGPNFFARGKYLGASIIEGFNKFTNNVEMGNFEVLAVRDTGELEHWFRENGGLFLWHRAGTATTSTTGAPALTFTGAAFKPGVLDIDTNRHMHSQFWAAVPNAAGGFLLVVHDNDPSSSTPWRVMTRLGPNDQFPNLLRDRQFVGVGLALTCLHSRLSVSWSWKELMESTVTEGFIVELADVLVAATSTDGALTIFVWNEDNLLGTPVGTRAWLGGVSITVPSEPNAQELRPFRGRPSLLQSDYALDEETSISPFEENHYGNLELFCAAKRGGIHHLWRDNGGNRGQPQSWEEGWHYAGLIGNKIYDDVSVIQSRFGRGEHGNLEMIARASDQAGFDFYWRDEDFHWHGPQIVTGDVASISQPLERGDSFRAMLAMGIDFSVKEADIRSWLADPLNTPYPAVSSALQFLFAGRRLRRPIFMDVIVFNYEDAPGVASPRSAADVSLPILIAAVLEGHNKRYGEHVTDLNQLL